MLDFSDDDDECEKFDNGGDESNTSCIYKKMKSLYKSQNINANPEEIILLNDYDIMVQDPIDLQSSIQQNIDNLKVLRNKNMSPEYIKQTDDVLIMLEKYKEIIDAKLLSDNLLSRDQITRLAYHSYQAFNNFQQANASKNILKPDRSYATQNESTAALIPLSETLF